MISTRLDIAYAVNNYTRYILNPSKDHYKALERIQQYIRTTKNKNIVCSSNNNIKPKLVGYIDSNQGGNYSTRKSTTGYIFQLGNSPISQSSRLQKLIVISSYKAEYMALKEATKELIQLKSLFSQIKLLNSYKTDTIYYDNKSAIDLSKNPKHYARTKHIDIQYHFVRDCITKELFQLLYISTRE